MSNKGIALRFVGVLIDGCGECSRDEAEGGVIDHCAKCKHAIVTDAYALFVMGGAKIECNDPKPSACCKRCGKRGRSKIDKASMARYAPYCTYHCQEWAKLEDVCIELKNRRG